MAFWLLVLKNSAAVVNEELCHLIGVAGGQVGEEGGATGGGDDAGGHVVHSRVRGNLVKMKQNDE